MVNRNRSLLQRFWLRVLLFAIRRGALYQLGSCSNRTWHAALFDSVEVKLTTRKLWEPDGYSREELLLMLHTVREHEAKQGWSVPEPSSAFD